ncbi:MAG: CNNM domain-containing protein [Planctomycetaceae bacterium]|nr:CNNM domain-containing protein [Planctomycetaceae bacterium]
MSIFLLSILIALGVSFVCSLLEAALLSLTPSQIAQMSARHPSAATAWQGFKANIERPIAVILILNTTAHTIGASVAGAQFDELFGDDLLWVFSIAFTLVMLQFTEILPKTIGVRLNTTLAPWMAAPLRALVVVFTPLIVVLHWLNRPFEGRRRAGARPVATVDEIAALAAMARMSKDIGAHQERVILGAARLSEKRVRDLMIPVEQVVMLSDDMPLPRAIVAAHLDAHTRFPISAGSDRSRVLGYVNFKEMIYFMSANPRDPSLKGIMRPITRVSPDDSATALMRVFVEEHEHIAIAEGPDGRTAGLVTLEDLVEELIGDLGDEFDRLPRYAHSLSGGTWLFGGGLPMDEIARATGGALPGGKEPFAVWLEARLGKSPAGGQTLRVEGAEISVRRVRRGRVFEASVAVG